MSATLESYNLEKLLIFKRFLEQQLKDVEKAIEDKTPGSKFLPFDEFHSKYVHGFRKDHPYSKELYNFYKEVYAGHEKEFGELVESWDGIYTMKQFGEEYYDYLREMYNVAGDEMDDEYSNFLSIGRKKYVSNLAIRYATERGIDKYKKYLLGGYYHIEFHELTSEEKRLIKNKSLPLPISDGKFKTFKGYDDEYDDE
jgi:hypothetical protein